ncbi:hypothetical protein [Dyella acidisoli]|uniref:Glycosyltransferase RgtA/B/C/D-like domain-containing protein n=1 Tax=Dyella acidisoli TaxID=1867834 RepID=A0ABQ5XLV9_9GAMM|nr:hypothetical protein [Dyella acidisoli]GLQ92352.1 hypothetical protein GCM10007901_13030 [Dyella acidisoli]
MVRILEDEAWYTDRLMQQLRKPVSSNISLFLLLVIWVASLVESLRAGRMRHIGDELVHIPQIESFLHGNYVANDALTMIPGYHLLVAVLLQITNVHSISAMRVITSLFGLLAALIFYLIRRTVNDSSPLKRAMMFLFLPLLYPYDFLIYTDVLSAALVLAAMLAVLKRRHMLSAAALTLSIFVRQNNVVWVGFMAMFAIWPILQEGQWQVGRTFKDVFRAGLPYLLPLSIFIGYWAWNGTIALEKSQAYGHPDLQWHRGNIYFFLFLVFVFFPNQVWFCVKDFFAKVWERPQMVLIPLVVFALAKLDGNFANLVAEHSIFHNGVIAVVRSGLGYHILFSALCALAACCLVCTRFAVSQGWLIYPFSAFYLSSSWMIENRYSIIPLVLWMGLQQVRNEKADSFVLLAWVVISVTLTHGIMHGWYML